jgi:parallel beta-helix repeat protein
MAVRARLRSAVRSDTGRRRTNNEDRYYVDADRGIFAVIDGVGGHAAGERAAELAVQVLRERLERQTGTPGERLREAIALANNEIYKQARSRPEWNGMACVLTIALIEDDVVTVGHVGDSRLYLLRPGEIHKITHDHSPVGEREDRGEITEVEAMQHARRNEIYRDVGSSERSPDDPAFIEITSFPMPSDSAILLCSDGLTDLISGPEIRACLERYAPDYDAAIRALIDAANHAGGKDNITVVVVAAPEYKVAAEETPTARMSNQSAARVGPVLVAGACGLALGLAMGLFFPWVRARLFVESGPRTLVVGSAGINAALSQAHPGDTVVIPQGKYTERIQLREGVTLRAQQPANVTLTSPDGGPAVIARKIETGSIEGVWIQGDLQAAANAGIRVEDASPAISNVRITGMLTGIEVRGASAPHISSSQIENNLGAGIDVAGNAQPNIENNLIAANGNGKPGVAKPGVEVGESARPVLKDNGIVNNAAEPIWVHGHSYQAADFEENFFGELSPKRAVRLIDEPLVIEKPEKKGKAHPPVRP